MAVRKALVRIAGKLRQLPAGDTIEGLVPSDDARLTDAREWTASTVSQAEAEAGTATTRRAWTAQRVFQAIAAWWAASAMKTKLDGIAAGATANSTDAQLRDRSTHTGTQAISTVTGLQTALDGKINTSERGVSGGIPTLDEFARIPPSQLPSYVDDVLDFATTAQFPATGEGGKIYIAINQGTAANPTRQYRWTGSVYAEINPSPGTTDALAEGSTNLYFSEHRVRNTVLTGLSLASSAAVAATDTVLAAFGKLQAQLGLKADLNSPAFTGNPTAPTPASSDNDTSIATTAFVRAAMALFGVGTDNVLQQADLDAITNTGLYKINNPTAGSPGFNYGTLIHVGRGVMEATQVAISVTTSQALFRRKVDGVWSAWQELWHTGNLVKQTSTTDTTAGALMAVGAGGLLSSGVPITDYNNPPNGACFLYASSGSTPNRPSASGTSYAINLFATTSYAHQLGAGIAENEFRFRNKNNGVWGDWNTLLHTGNFNPATKQDKSTVITTATSRTLALTDAWNYVRPGTTSAITLTVPTNAAVAFDVGTEITVRALGSITLAVASGVTLNAPSGGTLSMTARMTVTLKKTGADVWDVIGQTVAA